MNRLLIIALFCATIAGTVFLSGTFGGAYAENKVPPPSLDDPLAPTSAKKTAVFAGGCFWGVQGVFEHVAGVTKAVAGYSGGDSSTAKYEQVGTGTTGHAESVEVTYDPGVISYGTLLRIYFSVVADPTELNRQGPDHGTQYRSSIFATDSDEKAVAEAYIAQLENSKTFAAPIVTKVESFKGFYPAENYHQDFLARNPGYPYIVLNDLPKIAALHRLFPELYRDQPVLISAPAE